MAIEKIRRACTLAFLRNMAQHVKLIDFLFVLLVTVIWGASFSVVKVGLEELPPILFVALRFLIVAIPAIFLVPFPKNAMWSVIAVGTLIGIVKFGLLFIAMKQDAGASISSLLLQAQVFFTILLSYFLFKEKVSLSQLIGMMIAAIGFGAFFLSVGENITLTGLILVTSASLAWAAANLVMKKLEAVNLFYFMVWMSAIPPIPLLTLSFFYETSSPLLILSDLSLKAWFAVAYMGYFSTLLAYALWGYLLNRYTAVVITPFALLIPILGIFIAMLWLGERLSTLEIFGTLCVIAGLLFCFLGERIFGSLRPSETGTAK